jgi:hypothetical protein
VHKNFNPRLISFITDSERLQGRSPAQFWAYVCETLDNPADVWENPFYAQQDDFGRAIVVLVTLHGRGSREGDLAEGYARFCARPENHAMNGRRDFVSNLRHLTGSLLSRHMLGELADVTYINLYNPSIGDFVLRRLAKDLPQLRSGFLSLRSAGSLKTLLDLLGNRIVDAQACFSILRAILSEARQLEYAGYDAGYLAVALMHLLESPGFVSDDQVLAEATLEFVLAEEVPTQFLEAAKLIAWGIEKGLVDEDRAHDFIFRACGASPNLAELKLLSDIFDRLNPLHSRRSTVADRFKATALDYLADCVDDEIEVSEVFDGVDYGEISVAENNARNLISDWLERIGVTATRGELDEIVEAFDVESRQDKYFRGDDRASPEIRGPAFVDNRTDEIDDLFDRS